MCCARADVCVCVCVALGGVRVPAGGFRSWVGGGVIEEFSFLGFKRPVSNSVTSTHESLKGLRFFYLHTSTTFKYYTGLIEKSKTHFYGPRSGLSGVLAFL